MTKHFKAIGYLVLAYFVLVIVTRLSIGLSHNLLWICHAVLLLAGLGFVLNNNSLLTGSLILIFLPHLFWTIDYFLLLTGIQNLGITNYVLQADTLSYVLTLHHITLIPLLIWGIYQQKQVSKKGWIVAAAYFSFLTLFTILFTTPEYNINCAFQVCDTVILRSLEFVNKFNSYWAIQNTVMSFFVFFPLNKLFSKIIS